MKIYIERPTFDAQIRSRCTNFYFKQLQKHIRSSISNLCKLLNDKLGMIYYQRPAQYYAAPQRMMYVQYTHPSPFARSTQGAEALVAGESVATGTYLQGT